jgi:hypothetical protein
MPPRFTSARGSKTYAKTSYHTRDFFRGLNDTDEQPRGPARARSAND